MKEREKEKKKLYNLAKTQQALAYIGIEQAKSVSPVAVFFSSSHISFSLLIRSVRKNHVHNFPVCKLNFLLITLMKATAIHV